MLMVTLALFVLGSLAAMLAWNIWSLIVFRAIQGVGGAVYPLSFSIIRDEMPPERVGVAMGLISAMLGRRRRDRHRDERPDRRPRVVAPAVRGRRRRGRRSALVLVARFVPPSPTAPARASTSPARCCCPPG